MSMQKKKRTMANGKKSATVGRGGAKAAAVKPKLLSGGNPQIAKAYGDEPVQAYIAAMPGWKHDVGRRLDEIISRIVPGVRKAVKWNTPLYGAADEEMGWFMSFHCFNKYIKVAFFKGSALRPPPPEESKQKDVRYYHVHEGEEIDEKQLGKWVREASRMEGERM